MKRLLLTVLLLIFCSLFLCQACAEIVSLPVDLSYGTEPLESGQKSRHLYEDPSIRVEWTKVKYEDSAYPSAYHYAFIKLATAAQLRTYPAGKDFSRKIVNRVDVLARRVHSVLALNGDYYCARPVSYVLRQGVLYQDEVRENSDVLLIDEAGDFHIILAKEDPASADKTTWDGKKIVNAFNFGPALFRNDEMVMDVEASPYMSEPEARAQRMVIAQVGTLEYMVFTCSNSVGMSLADICELLPQLTEHIIAAYVLDGGNSAQLCFLGKKINTTQNDVNVRKVSDIIYFASAWKEDE